mmetsp:Transcript_13656/g.39353  ORF Transcript_13656/g.39353 Transcript_13656/m.39353 type:complete len:213 (-) Transcript_13656:24-662(-)
MLLVPLATLEILVAHVAEELAGRIVPLKAFPRHHLRRPPTPGARPFAVPSVRPSASLLGIAVLVIVVAAPLRAALAASSAPRPRAAVLPPVSATAMPRATPADVGASVSAIPRLACCLLPPLSGRAPLTWLRLPTSPVLSDEASSTVAGNSSNGALAETSAVALCWSNPMVGRRSAAAAGAAVLQHTCWRSGRRSGRRRWRHHGRRPSRCRM